MKIKEKIIKCKEWVKEHKGAIVGSSLGLLATVGLVAVAKKNKKDDDVYPYGDGTEPDYGRDCTMRFIVDETQEVLGEVKCTELYAKEEIEMFNEFNK